MTRTSKRGAKRLAPATAAICSPAMIHSLLGAGLDLSVGCSGGEVRVAVATSDQVAPEGCACPFGALGIGLDYVCYCAPSICSSPPWLAARTPPATALEVPLVRFSGWPELLLPLWLWRGSGWRGKLHSFG